MMEPMMATLVFRFCVNKAHRRVTEFVSNDSVLVFCRNYKKCSSSRCCNVCLNFILIENSDFMLYTSGFFVVVLVCCCSWFIRCSGRIDGLERRKRIFTIKAKEARSAFKIYDCFSGSSTVSFLK